VRNAELGTLWFEMVEDLLEEQAKDGLIAW